MSNPNELFPSSPSRKSPGETNASRGSITADVKGSDLEQSLRDLPRVGTCLKNRRYRQVWRFEHQGSGYILKFYPRGGSVGARLKRLWRGNPAQREFLRLQMLQRADISAPRAIAQLVGYELNGQLGDAVILEAIEPAEPLDAYVNRHLLAAEPIPNHYDLVQQILAILEKLGSAKLGHDDLHLGNFLLKDGRVYLLDGYAVQTGGLKLAHVMGLAHSARAIATRADLQRGWNELGPGGRMPVRNPVSRQHWRKLTTRWKLCSCSKDNAYFGRIALGGSRGNSPGDFRGVFFKQYKYPRRWAPASVLTVSAEQWQKAWPTLWEQMNSGQLKPLKRSASGDVFAGEVPLGGKTVPIILKRPYRRKWYRYFNEIGRGSRSWRAWHKAWNLVVRDLPTAWPLLVLQKRTLGYITDSIIIFERVEGQMLSHCNLEALSAGERDLLFRRTGRVLRQIDDLGLGHFDAKSNNWMVQRDEKRGPGPILIDVDGIRFRQWWALGIGRLLRSMELHRQYTPADSLALCQGYAPYSPMNIRMTEAPADAASSPSANENSDESETPNP